MKFVKGLSEAERRTLLDASRYAPWPRFRQRTHAVLLSGKHYNLARIFHHQMQGHGLKLGLGL